MEVKTTSPYLVKVSFIHAINPSDGAGGRGEPIITIWDNEGEKPRYAFPYLTRRMKDIYENILSPFADWRMDYSPEHVTVYIPIINLSKLDPLRERIDYLRNEGDDWGDLSFDEEMLLNYNPGNIDEIDYVPLLESIGVSAWNSQTQTWTPIM